MLSELNFHSLVSAKAAWKWPRGDLTSDFIKVHQLHIMQIHKNRLAIVKEWLMFITLKSNCLGLKKNETLLKLNKVENPFCQAQHK